jgi:hypothetical protein
MPKAKMADSDADYHGLLFSCVPEQILTLMGMFTKI